MAITNSDAGKRVAQPSKCAEATRVVGRDVSRNQASCGADLSSLSVRRTFPSGIAAATNTAQESAVNRQTGMSAPHGARTGRSRLQRSVLGLWLATALALPGAENDAEKFARRAERNYLEAKKRYKEKPNDAEAAWQFGRAAFDRAEFAQNDDQREEIADEGITACRQLVARDPKSAAGHYYLGMNLGQLARTRTLGALKLVDEMEREFKRARDFDPEFDYAGADRNLGLLYFEAPGWPTSIGSKSKARQHLQRAVVAAPRYPENRLCLLEAYLKWGDRKGVARETTALADLLPKAREEFTGEAWEQSWQDWEKRWEKIQERAKAAGP